MDRAVALCLALTLAAAGCTGTGEDPADRTASERRQARAAGVEEALPVPAALLWNDPYHILQLEVDYVKGREPSSEAFAAFIEEVRNITLKEEIVVVGPREIPDVEPDPTRVRTYEELRQLHEGTFEGDTDPYRSGRGEVAFLHVLFPDGVSDLATAGLAFDNVIIVFRDGMRDDDAWQLAWTARGQRHVLVHEFGHAIGLVNCGIPMLTARQQNGCHSANGNSVMYAGGILESIGNDHEYFLYFIENRDWYAFTYDEADREDVAAFQARQHR